MMFLLLLVRPLTVFHVLYLGAFVLRDRFLAPLVDGGFDVTEVMRSTHLVDVVLRFPQCPEDAIRPVIGSNNVISALAIHGQSLHHVLLVVWLFLSEPRAFLDALPRMARRAERLEVAVIK